jgi:hypothetical protein
MCGKTTCTCNGNCVTQHNKRKGSASYGALRQVRQHHKVCHKDHDQGLQVIDEHEQMGSMESCSHDFSSILPSDGEAAETLGVDNLPFWGYALAFADLIEDTDRFRYAVVRSGWQHLNAEYTWSEYD